MASITLTLDQQRFPAGATVSAYKTSNFYGAAVDTAPQGTAPRGSADTTGTVTATGTVTLLGLTVDQDYYGVYNASGDYRYVSFDTMQSASTVRSRDAVLRSRNPINVLDEEFGASGDGVTDDYAAITAAIEKARAARGGEVFLPARLYRLSAPLKLYDSVHLWGETPSRRGVTKGTILQPLTDAAFAGKGIIDVNNGGGTTYCGVHSMVLTAAGTDATANTVMGVTDFLDTAHSCKLGLFTDLYFYNLGGQCIALYGNVNRILRPRADECASHVIHLKNSGVEGTGSDNEIYDVDTGYCNGNGAGSGSSGDGIYLDGASNNKIFGGKYYNHKIGLHLNGAVGNQFDLPRCEKNDAAGIYLEGACVDNQILGVKLFSNGFISDFAGLRLNGACVDNRITGTVENDLNSLIPGVTAITCTTNGTTTISAISDVTKLRVDQRVTGTNIPASTFVVSINTGAATAVLSTAASGSTVGGNIAGYPTDKGVVLQGAATQNDIDIQVTGVNSHALQIDEAYDNRVNVKFRDVGQSGVVIGGSSGTKDHNRVRAFGLDAGQRTDATYDAFVINAGSNNVLHDFQYFATLTKKARNVVFINPTGPTAPIVRNGLTSSSACTGSTYSDTGLLGTVRNYIGFTNTAPTVTVPASAGTVAADVADRYFYTTSHASSSCTYTVQNGAAPVVPAGAFGVVFVPGGNTMVPTYTSTNAPTWVVHRVGR